MNKVGGERESGPSDWSPDWGPDALNDAWEIHIARQRLKMCAVPLLVVGAFVEAMALRTDVQAKRPLSAAFHGIGLALLGGAAYLRSLK